ncbi:hypothetical protein BGZ99_004778, partial [Dissophora globulifera]
MHQQVQQNVLPWQGYGISQPHPQDTDLHFEVGVASQQPDLAMSSPSTSMAHATAQEPETFPSILSPVSAQSPAQSTRVDLRSFAGHLGTALDPRLATEMGSSSGIGGMNQHEMLAQQQHLRQSSSLDEQSSKLQFSPGYVWNQENNSDSRTVHGHTRHQSASHVYPQQTLQLQSSAQQRANWTRSLKDMTNYTSALIDQQQRMADPTQLLREDVPILHPSTLDQGAPYDSFGASLALVLDDNLRLLDDMDVVPELNDYEGLAQPSLTSSTQSGKDVMLQGVRMSNHPDNPVAGSSPPAVAMTHQPQRSIFSTISGSTTSNGQGQIIIGGNGMSNTLGHGTGILHFQGDPYIDTLSFLDLSGTFMTSGTASGAAAASSSASTSS